MLSENRLKRKTIGQKPDQTYEDYQDTSKNDTLYNIIKVGLIGATTYGLYKTGALKSISKPLLELADKVASEGGDTAAATMSAVRKWANLKELSSSQLFRSTTQSHTPPNRSLFRNRDTSFLYDLAEDLRNGHRNGRYKFENLSRLQQDTTADMHLLFDMIGESKTTRAASKGSFKETDLNFKIKQRNEFLKTLKENAAKQDPEQMLMASKANETLIQDILADDATMAQELKESGYRKMLLSDIFEYNTDGEFVVKQNKPKGLSDDFIEDLKRAVGQNFGTDVRYTKDGKGTTLFGSGDWKNVIIDSAMRIDEKGNMIDYRMAKKDIIGFAHSLANDFGLPVVQFNPFKSILHLDKVGRKQPLMGMLSPEQFVPGITRIGGHGDEAKLGNWLGDTFGEKFRNKNVSVFGEKAYINDGNKLIQIADNLRLIDITYADEQYGLKPMHNAFRQISNLELGHYDPKSKFAKLFGLGSQEILNEQEEIARRLDNLTSIDEITDKFLGNVSDKAMYKALNLKELGYDTLDDFLQEIKATEGFNFKSTFGQGFAKNGKHQPRMFDVTPKGFTFEDSMTGVYESLKKGDTGDAYENLKKFVAQYFVGRNADNHLDEYATERSGGFIWNILNGVADGARAVHLGLPTESKRSSLIMGRDLLLKRVLPIYAALQIPGMINYFTEPFFGDEDENGNRDNITKFMMRDVVKPIDIGAHHLMDLTGATKLFKFLGDMTPGSDQVSELPGIHALGLGQTAEERKDYIENGYDPIRKGRWWGAGNCIIPTQQIQTGYGVTKLAQDVNIGDNVITHEGILKPVLKVITRNMKQGEWCPEIKLHTDIFTNITTDNHPYLCVKKKHCPSIDNIDCRPDRKSIYCDKCVYHQCSNKHIWIPQWTLARDIEVGDYLAYPRIKILGNRSTINGLPANYDIGYILGAFLAEGNIHRYTGDTPRGIELTVCEDEDIFISNIITILDKYFEGNTKGIKLKKNSRGFTIRNLCVKVSKWFHEVLYTDRNKHFIPNIYEYNEEFIKGVLTGLFDGDGHIQITRSNTLNILYTSARLEYAIQVRNLLFSLGIHNSIRHHGNNAYRIIVTGDAALNLDAMLRLYKTENLSFKYNYNASKYQVIDDNFVYIKVESIKRNDYFGLVYDYEIQDSHSFCSLSTIMHNTPLSGGKIMYFRPNLYRRVEADVDFSDSKWGSRQEYYNNTWFPNPVNPFAPINHFITDRHHYDKKHYYDRPYLQTAPEGSSIPIIGPLFSNTIGKVIMPQKKMHLEYWRNGLQVDPNDESPSPLLTDGSLSDVQAAGSFGIRRSFNVSNIQQAKIDITEYNNMQLRQQQVNKLYQEQLGVAQYQAKKVLSKSFIDKSGITFEQRNILPYRSYDRYDNKYEAYSTPSGALNVVDVPDELNLYDVNKDLQRYSINKVIGTNQRVDVNDIDSPSIPVGNDSKSVDNAFIYGLGEQYNWLGEVAGLKGFALQQFVTGHGNEKARVIEDSGYAYSWNKDFWDANMGGLGGNLSEITRRFIPKRNNNTEFVNPIRNTMPSWMPGSNYFTDFKHGDPYSKIENGEERLPGEGYERLNHINGLMNLNIGSSSIGYDKAYIVRHMLKQDKVKNTFEEDTLETGTKLHAEIEKSWKDAGLAISTEGEIKDTENGIVGYYDAIVKDPTSKTGISIVDIKTTSAKKLDEIRKAGKPLDHHQRQVNYYLWATKNQNSKGYIYYVDKENPNNNYTVGFNYDNNMLKDTLNNVYAARKEIRDAIQNGVIGRGELYSTMDKFRILADVAPYSQEFKDVSAQLSSEDLSEEEKEEASQIRERVKQQKEPLRVYDYRFKTANLQKQTVTVDKIIDNNTIVTKEYGKEHSVKFAGINVSESNSEYYKTWDEEYKDKRGRKRKRKTGITMNDAARNEIRKYIRPGQRITIEYDADDTKKFSKDSTRSIRAVVTSRGRNVNRVLLNKQLAKEKDDDSPAGIHARYTNGEIAFGSAMETLTHDVVGRIPFVGSKFLQVRSPYEQYRKREVYSKDFQSWNHPIRDLLIPSIQENIGDNSLGGLGGIIAGAFIGSMFGRKGSKFGTLVGATLGGLIPAIGKIGVAVTHHDKDRDWRPKRRRDQEELNEYVDTLKYVKNMRLYEQYKIKSLKEDHFDVEKFMKSKEAAGVSNKLRQQELTDFKRKVKLDFKHRDRYNFKYGKPKYVDMKMDKKATISAINQELSELQSQRKVTKLPANALKAIQYKQTADKTMYGYNPGDSLVNIMSALPKKDRQYFKHFIDAPEEEKGKILRIAPEYLRRALQSSWGMKVDKKPSLNEYFQTHGLPDASWVGWDENTNIDDVKVKLVHQNKMDPGEFDIWDDNKKQADQTNIPIPMINARNSARQTQLKLTQILGKAGYDNVQVDYMTNSVGKNNTKIHVKHDARDDVESQIASLDYENI